MTSPTKQYVEKFAEAMEARLAENRHKGDRPGWLKEAPTRHAKRAGIHIIDLEDAIESGAPVEEVRTLAANAANRLMMAVDSYEASAAEGSK